MRSLSVIKAIGCCESNHRKYTYRVKGQGKYWSEEGAEGILRILTCIKNNDLEEWLSSDFQGSSITIYDEEQIKGAVRASFKKVHEIHEGVQHGSLEAYVAGNSSLSNFARSLSHVNI